MLVAQHDNISIEYLPPDETKKDHGEYRLTPQHQDGSAKGPEHVALTLADMIQFIKGGDLPSETIKELVYQLGG